MSNPQEFTGALSERNEALNLPQEENSDDLIFKFFKNRLGYTWTENLDLPDTAPPITVREFKTGWDLETGLSESSDPDLREKVLKVLAAQMWSALTQYSSSSHPNFTPLLRPRSFSVPSDVRTFSESRGFLSVIQEAPYKASAFFPGFKKSKYSLEQDPEEPSWVYIQLVVTVQAQADDVLKAMNRFDKWLIEVLPPEELTSFAVVTEYID